MPCELAEPEGVPLPDVPEEPEEEDEQPVSSSAAVATIVAGNTARRTMWDTAGLLMSGGGWPRHATQLG